MIDKILEKFGYVPVAMVQRYARIQLEYGLLVKELKKQISELIKDKYELLKEKNIRAADLSEYKGSGMNMSINQMFSSSTFIADNHYLVFSMQTWKEILTKCRNTFYFKFKAESADCDNYASIMCAAVQQAAIESGLDLQPAFGYAIQAGVHAYNIFVADGKPYIYEPQNNTIKGLLGQTDKPYNTNRIFFIG